MNIFGIKVTLDLRGPSTLSEEEEAFMDTYLEKGSQMYTDDEDADRGSEMIDNLARKGWLFGRGPQRERYWTWEGEE